jgi:hypothetical protein
MKLTEVQMFTWNHVSTSALLHSIDEYETKIQNLETSINLLRVMEGNENRLRQCVAMRKNLFENCDQLKQILKYRNERH